MDTRSLYLFYALSEDLNMTKTASRLFIAQQTLSNNIIRLEKEFHTQLFIRKPKLALTEAGKHMVVLARNILKECREFEDVVADIDNEEYGVVRFGATAMRFTSCLGYVLPKFSARYPKVSIDVIDNPSPVLQKKVLSGDIDLALCVQNDNTPALTTELVLADRIYLCVAERLLQRFYGMDSNSIKYAASKGASVANFSKLPFFILATPNRLGNLVKKCFEDAGFMPKVYLTTTSSRVAPMVCSEALAACFITQMNLIINKERISYDTNIFPLLYGNKQLKHNVYLVHATKRYLPKYMRYFMQLVKDFYKGFDTNALTYIYEDNKCKTRKKKLV